MNVSKSVLECPFCFELLEVKSPDRFHTAYSQKKPIPNSYHADVVVKKHRCQNPACKKTITAYWYAPLDYFSRI